MTRSSILRIGLFFTLLLATTLSRGQEPGTAVADLTELEEQSFREAAALLEPSIVQIQTVGGLDRIGGVSTGTGPTTGVVVSADGLIVSSSFNFASKPASILVSTPDNRRFPATILGTDRSRKITLLKVEAQNLVPVQAVPRDEYRVGQWAIALGRTYSSAFPSVSVGIISALNRVWGRAMQTDAKISPVNYGGPLAAIDGRVLGILVAMSPRGETDTAGVEWYDSGIGFAVPMVDVLASVEKLKNGADLFPGKLGINLNMKDQFAAPELLGVAPESPADKAGLEPKDLITSIDDVPVSRISEVRFLLGPHYAGDRIKIAVRRGEEMIERTVELVAEVPEYRFPWLGILPKRSNEVDQQGARVRYVFPSGPAGSAGLKAGDIVQKFNDQPIQSSDDLRQMVIGTPIDSEVRIEGIRDGEPFAATCRLSELDPSIPAELTSVAVPPGAPGGADAPERGRFSFEMEAHSHSCWAYVPEDYNPDARYGLMVWIHPSGDSMEATIMRQWKAECDRRGLMILAPKASGEKWIPNEAEFVRDAVQEFMEKYPIDPERVFIHAFQSAGPAAFLFASSERDWFRGIALCSSSIRSPIPDNDPGYRTQVLLHWGKSSPQNEQIQSTAKAFQKAGYPVIPQAINGLAEQYPEQDQVRLISRWADSLDRI